MKPVKIYWPLLFIGLIGFRCSFEREIQHVERTKIGMDTFIRITVFDNDKEPGKVEEAINDAFAVIDRIEKLTNNYSDSSQIGIINTHAGGTFETVDEDIIHILTEAQSVSQLSGGAFDITIGSVMSLWDFTSGKAVVPPPRLISENLKLVNFEDVQINGNKIRLRKPGMRIDPGGIAKGYAIDRAMEVLQKHGITDAMVDAGGDLRAISSRLTQGKRKVWIRHPRQRDAFFGYFKMDTGSVATSGDYERYFTVDSLRYHHILDPRTGYPARQCTSVTIMAESATRADALATAVFVLGPEKGLKLIEDLEEVEGVIIYQQHQTDLRWKVSSGLAKKIIIVNKGW